MSNNQEHSYQASIVGNKEGGQGKGVAMNHNTESELRNAYEQCEKCFHSFTQNNKTTGLTEAILKLNTEFKRAHEEGGPANQKQIDLVKKIKQLLEQLEKIGMEIPK